jgi:hypothetical protein
MSEIEWASGLAEAEGCFTWEGRAGMRGKRLRFRLAMVAEDSVQRFAQAVDPGLRLRTSQQAGKRPLLLFDAWNDRALHVAATLGPWLGERRRERVGIEAALRERGVAWLGGIVEGDGAWRNNCGRLSLKISMTDRDVVESAARILGRPVRKTPGANARCKPVFTVSAYGPTALDASSALLPYMGERNTLRIERIVASHRTDTQGRGRPAVSTFAAH